MAQRITGIQLTFVFIGIALVAVGTSIALDVRKTRGEIDAVQAAMRAAATARRQAEAMADKEESLSRVEVAWSMLESSDEKTRYEYLKQYNLTLWLALQSDVKDPEIDAAIVAERKHLPRKRLSDFPVATLRLADGTIARPGWQEPTGSTAPTAPPAPPGP